MVKNRKYPFGYRMEQGKMVIDPKEAEIVTVIFQQYTTGASYLDLVRMLQTQPVPYDIGRLWNKGMVARILEDERYIGKGGCPAILHREVFQQAGQNRRRKQKPSQLTEAQKVLRRLSGQKVRTESEQQIRVLLNSLIEAPETIQQPAQPIIRCCTEKLESELEVIMESQPIKEDTARQLILQIAAVRYGNIPPDEYETQRLRRIFAKTEQMERLDPELLKSTISEIKIGDGFIAIRLKNNQIIERRVPT